jgi:hypothetical protein
LGLFSLIIFGYYIKDVLILKKLFIGIFDITDTGWKIVSIRWMVFAFLLSFSNQLALWYFYARAVGYLQNDNSCRPSLVFYLAIFSFSTGTKS